MSKPRTSFTPADLIAGLTPDYLLGLIDDVKWRDSTSKAVQCALKLAGAVIQDHGLLSDESRKETVASTSSCSTIPQLTPQLSYCIARKALIFINHSLVLQL